MPKASFPDPGSGPGRVDSAPRTGTADNGPSPGRVRAGLIAYLAIAFAGMWLAMAPLLLSGFERTGDDTLMGPLVSVCIAVAMCSPAAAALIVRRFVERRGDVRSSLALTLPRPWGRAVRDCAAGVLVPFALLLAALAVGAAAGVYHVDLAGLSGFRESLAPEAAGTAGPPWGALAAWAGSLLLSMVVWVPMFFGEELGWQGYLFPRLQRYGFAVALAGTGVAFALWHLPTLLMGGQYPGHSLAASVGAMLVSCLLSVPIFTWLRLRSGSVVPAVLAHTVMSSANVQTAQLFSAADHSLDPMHVGLTGWPGWVVMGGFVAFLVLTGRLHGRS